MMTLPGMELILEHYRSEAIQEDWGRRTTSHAIYAAQLLQLPLWSGMLQSVINNVGLTGIRLGGDRMSFDKADTLRILQPGNPMICGGHDVQCP